MHWPGDHSTYTAAAVVLAADALADATPGADIMRGRTLVPHFDALALECGCAVTRPAGRRVRHSRRTA